MPRKLNINNANEAIYKTIDMYDGTSELYKQKIIAGGFITLSERRGFLEFFSVEGQQIWFKIFEKTSQVSTQTNTITGVSSVKINDDKIIAVLQSDILTLTIHDIASGKFIRSYVQPGSFVKRIQANYFFIDELAQRFFLLSQSLVDDQSQNLFIGNFQDNFIQPDSILISQDDSSIYKGLVQDKENKNIGLLIFNDELGYQIRLFNYSSNDYDQNYLIIDLNLTIADTSITKESAVSIFKFKYSDQAQQFLLGFNNKDGTACLVHLISDHTLFQVHATVMSSITHPVLMDAYIIDEQSYYIIIQQQQYFDQPPQIYVGIARNNDDIIWQKEISNRVELLEIRMVLFVDYNAKQIYFAGSLITEILPTTPIILSYNSFSFTLTDSISLIMTFDLQEPNVYEVSQLSQPQNAHLVKSGQYFSESGSFQLFELTMNNHQESYNVEVNDAQNFEIIGPVQIQESIYVITEIQQPKTYQFDQSYQIDSIQGEQCDDLQFVYRQQVPGLDFVFFNNPFKNEFQVLTSNLNDIGNYDLNFYSLSNSNQMTQSSSYKLKLVSQCYYEEISIDQALIPEIEWVFESEPLIVDLPVFKSKILYCQFKHTVVKSFDDVDYQTLFNFPTEENLQIEVFSMKKSFEGKNFIFQMMVQSGYFNDQTKQLEGLNPQVFSTYNLTIKVLPRCSQVKLIQMSFVQYITYTVGTGLKSFVFYPYEPTVKDCGQLIHLFKYPAPNETALNPEFFKFNQNELQINVLDQATQDQRIDLRFKVFLRNVTDYVQQNYTDFTVFIKAIQIQDDPCATVTIVANILQKEIEYQIGQGLQQTFYDIWTLSSLDCNQQIQYKFEPQLEFFSYNNMTGNIHINTNKTEVIGNYITTLTGFVNENIYEQAEISITIKDYCGQSEIYGRNDIILIHYDLLKAEELTTIIPPFSFSEGINPKNCNMVYTLTDQIGENLDSIQEDYQLQQQQDSLILIITQEFEMTKCNKQDVIYLKGFPQNYPTNFFIKMIQIFLECDCLQSPITFDKKDLNITYQLGSGQYMIRLNYIVVEPYNECKKPDISYKIEESASLNNLNWTFDNLESMFTVESPNDLDNVGLYVFTQVGTVILTSNNSQSKIPFSRNINIIVVDFCDSATLTFNSIPTEDIFFAIGTLAQNIPIPQQRLDIEFNDRCQAHTWISQRSNPFSNFNFYHYNFYNDYNNDYYNLNDYYILFNHHQILGQSHNPCSNFNFYHYNNLYNYHYNLYNYHYNLFNDHYNLYNDHNNPYNDHYNLGQSHNPCSNNQIFTIKYIITNIRDFQYMR
eukprot:403332218